MREKRISSRDNARFKELRTYLEPRGIRKSGFCILSGRKLTIEVSSDALVCAIIATPDMSIDHLLVATNQAHNQHELLQLDRELFDELDQYGTKSPLLVLKTPTLPHWKSDVAPVGLELLCALGEPSNLGALLRTAAGLNVSKVILLKECASPFHPKALRSAAGATFKIPLESGPSIHDLCTENSGQRNDRVSEQEPIYALDMGGENLADFSWPENVRLLLGEEGPGIPKAGPFHRITIATSGNIESLNATIAASLAIFHYRLRHTQLTPGSRTNP